MHAHPGQIQINPLQDIWAAVARMEVTEDQSAIQEATDAFTRVRCE